MQRKKLLCICGGLMLGVWGCGRPEPDERCVDTKTAEVLEPGLSFDECRFGQLDGGGSDFHEEKDTSAIPLAALSSRELADRARTGRNEDAWQALQELIRRTNSEDARELLALLASVSSARVRAGIVGEGVAYSSPDSRTLFFNALGCSNNAEVIRFSQQALANIADAGLVGELHDRYRVAETDTERRVLAEILLYMDKPELVSAVAKLMLAFSDLSEPLPTAAIGMLAAVGTQEALDAILGIFSVTTDPVNQGVLLAAMDMINREEARVYLSGGSGKRSQLKGDRRH